MKTDIKFYDICNTRVILKTIFGFGRIAPYEIELYDAFSYEYVIVGRYYSLTDAFRALYKFRKEEQGSPELMKYSIQ